mgnify:CR=1 FL=1
MSDPSITQSAVTNQRLHWFTSFKRSQVASVLATAVDFLTLVVLVEVIGVWYVFSTAAGAFLGAVTHFTLGRHWSFKATDKGVQGQMLRYGVVALGSLLLNTYGVYLLTDFIGFQYMVSKVITALSVGCFFNFPLHRHVVFR